jgi:hypothetical protein
MLTRAAVAMDRLWQVSASEMESVENMSSGLFGDVLRCRWGQRAVILKRLHVTYDPIDDYADRAFERLSGEYRQLQHAHLAVYFGAGIFPEGLCVCVCVCVCVCMRMRGWVRGGVCEKIDVPMPCVSSPLVVFSTWHLRLIRR